jgi:hypothetical protein
VPEQYLCLGLSFLGSCFYNPAQPTPIYFSIGNAIAALALTLAIQQFLNPIYRFRLRAYGLKIGYLILPVFLGFGCTLVAALLPYLPLPRKSFLEYPVVWEFFGSVLIATAYGAAAFIIFRPARIYRFNLYWFVGAGAALLTEADDADRARFAEDLLGYHRNLARLIEYASAWGRAEWHEDWIELERLKEAGLQQSFQGRAPISAFYRFAHRKELAAASHAGTFLRILSDPQFCAVLVRRCPWLTAANFQFISAKRLYAQQMVLFVQEIAVQSITNDESIIAKELGYEGFGATPYLSNSLFGDWFLLQHYDPLQKMHLHNSNELSQGYVSRLNGVSKMIVETAIGNQEFYPQGYMHSVHSAYENVFQELSYRRYKDVPRGLLGSLHFGITRIYKVLDRALANMPLETLAALYATEGRPQPWDNLVSAIATIVYESLESIANSFDGIDDPNWVHAITVFMDVFPTHGKPTVGFDPFQQHLAIRFVEKLQQNLQGFHPAISRVLLPVIGPYEQPDQITNLSAFGILRDAVYKELKNLNQLYIQKPDRFGDYLPPQVKYDPITDALTFTYRLGDRITTNLATLSISDVDLLDPKYRQWTPIGDGMGWAL